MPTPDPKNASLPADSEMMGVAHGEIRLLKQRTNDLETALNSKNESQDSALNQEISTRETADSTETSARVSADQTLQSNIDTLAASVSNVDNTSDVDKPVSTAQGEAIEAALEAAWPVNSIYLTVGDQNPNTIFGFGTWVKFSEGQMLMTSGESFPLEATGGTDRITITENNLPPHNHAVNDPGHSHSYSDRAIDVWGERKDFDEASFDENDYRDLTRTTESSVTGITVSDGGFSNVPIDIRNPYLAVAVWKRTA